MKIVDKKISSLKASEYNPRKISTEQMGHLKKSLQYFLAVEPIVVNMHPDRKNIIIGGHQRIKAAKALGWKEFPCVEVNLAIEQEKELNIRLNKNTGDFDFELLEQNFDVSDLVDWGFDEDDFDPEPGGEGGDEGEDDVPEPPQDPVTKRGDVWILDKHRLLCGDATVKEDVDKLMDGKKADMVLTDPPYGMNLDTDWSAIKGSDKSKPTFPAGRKYDAVIDDNEDFSPELIHTIFKHFAYCKEVFLFGADYYAELLPKKNDGSWLVWDKRREGVEDLIGAEFELCWSKAKHKRRMLRHLWCGAVSAEGNEAHNRMHPTQKPTFLLKDILQQWGKEGDLVVDLYAGSGSILIACEKTNRTCFGSEIDPKYCDVIVKRWQDYTSKQAVHADTGEKYPNV